MKESDVFLGDMEIQDLNLYLLEGHGHPLMTGTRDKIIAIPGMPGAYDYGADLESIAFSLPLVAIRKNRMDIQRMVRVVKSLLIDGQGYPKTIKLIFGYEPDKYYNVRYTGQIDIERILGQTGSFMIPLTCFDGHAWSTAKASEVVWGSETITFENDVYQFGHSGDGTKTFDSPGATIVTVSGGNVHPTLNITGSGTDVTVKCNGKDFTLGSFTDANWIVDLKEYAVIKNGVNAIHLIQGKWIGMELTQGENEIEISGSGLDLDFSVDFRDRYF